MCQGASPPVGALVATTPSAALPIAVRVDHGAMLAVSAPVCGAPVDAALAVEWNDAMTVSQHRADTEARRDVGAERDSRGGRRSGTQTVTAEERNSPDVPATDLIDLAGGLARAFGRLSRLARIPLVTAQISVPRMRLLTLMEDHGPQRIAQLAIMDQVSQPSVTSMVDAMSEAGWVVRSRDPSDGRAVLITITDAGREQLERARWISSHALARHLQALKPEQLETLVRALPAMQELMRMLRSAEASG